MAFTGKYRLDALERIDTNLNTFFARQLEQIRPTLFQRKYAAFKGRTFLPVKNDINLGAQVYTYQTIDEAGEARPVTDQGDDAPTIELKGSSEDTHKMRGIEIAYAWTIDEARAAMFAGQDLDTRKAVAARKAIERFIDKNMLLGGTVNGAVHQGLFALSGGQAPTTYTLANPVWDVQTPDEVAIDLNGMITKVITDTFETESCNAMIAPVSTKRMLRDRRMGDGSNVSIEAYFLGSQEEIKQIDTSLYLETSGGHSGGAVKRVVAYTKDSDHLEALVNEFEQLPPEFRAAKVVTLCRARVGGLATYFPKAIVYADNA